MCCIFLYVFILLINIILFQPDECFFSISCQARVGVMKSLCLFVWGTLYLSISVGQLYWIKYSWLAIFFPSHFENIIPFSWPVRFLLRIPLIALWGFLCKLQASLLLLLLGFSLCLWFNYNVCCRGSLSSLVTYVLHEFKISRSLLRLGNFSALISLNKLAPSLPLFFWHGKNSIFPFFGML